MRSKQRGLVLGAIVAALLGGGALCEARQEPARGVVIHYVADWHARFEPWIRSGDGRPLGGASRLASLLESRRRIAEQQGLETLFVAAGDSFFGSLTAAKLEGEPSRAVLELMKLDALTPGAHDFDFSWETLRRLTADADFVTVAANVSGPPELAEWAVLERGGRRIGIVGVLAEGRHPTMTSITFTDPVEAVRRLVEHRGSVDVLVVLSHCGEAVDRELAKIAGVDLVIGGRDHRLVEPRIDPRAPAAGDSNPDLAARAAAPVAHPSSDGAYLGEAVLLSVPGGMRVVANSFLPVRGALDEHPAVRAFLDETKERLERSLNEPLATVETALDHDFEILYFRESALGNLVADSMRSETGADAALINGGAVRAGFPQGAITDRHLLEALPFGNNLLVVELSGRDLWKIFERSWESLGNGGFLQVSGIEVVYGSDGSPIVRVGGSPVDPEARYRIAIPDFLYQGGDGYEGFATASPTPESTRRLVRDAVRRFVVEQGNIVAETEGRIRFEEPGEKP